MGRKRKYETLNEIQEARRKWRREYYQRNKAEIQSKRMYRYWRSKGMAEKV